MDFDDFEWSQGAPTPATTSETMCDMFLFRTKKMCFFEKMNFGHFALLYSYAEGELQSVKINGNQWKSMIFMKSAIFALKLTFGIAVE